MRLFPVTIGRECQIRGHERPRAGQDKDKQQDGKYKARHAADQTDRRS